MVVFFCAVEREKARGNIVGGIFAVARGSTVWALGCTAYVEGYLYLRGGGTSMGSMKS